MFTILKYSQYSQSMQHLVFYLLSFLISQCCLGQTTYVTIADGDWDNTPSWSPSEPPNTLAVGDSIIVSHTMYLNADQIVLGTMMVTDSAVINGSNKNKITVGKGSVSDGELINYGTISINKLIVKPDNGCVPSNDLPAAYNYGVIDLFDDLNVGNNCGRGAFFNYNGGKVYVGDQIHLDNYLCNQDSMFVVNVVLVHGGTIDCCGYIETPEIDIDANGSRASALECIDICDQSATSPLINIGGTNFIDLNDAYNNAPTTETTIDDDSTLICGLNQLGVNVALPLEIIDFKLNAINNHQVELLWKTELINDIKYFVIERSEDGLFFLPVSTIESVKNSSDQTTYTWDDTEPISGIAYYRIKQENQDGSERYSDIRSITCTPQNNKNVTIFPNPFSDEVTISMPDEINERVTIQLFNTLGQLVEQTTFKSKIRHTWKLNNQIVAGMYIIRVDDGEAIFQQKMTKY